MTTTFTVTAERGSGPVWVLECPDVGAVSQTRRLDHAADEMREAIAYLSGVDESDIEIVVEPRLPSYVAELKARAESLREQADDVNEQAARASRDLVAQLKQQGYSLRDIGVLLGVSHQRVAALAASVSRSGDDDAALAV
ncbi:hypothetical protein [Corynebacterium sp.]|uniref:hypothetical protein n=1 Tax=Corynebacterium sp. TaxID=1720 RepID=UPI003B3AEC67